MRWFSLLLAIGCGPSPFANDPPVIEAINGEPWTDLFGISVTPGESIDIAVEASDPEGDTFTMSVSRAPAGVTVDDDLTIHWDVPDPFWMGSGELDIVLDDHRKKQRGYASYLLLFSTDGVLGTGETEGDTDLDTDALP